MRSVEITRAGDRSIFDQLVEMRSWLAEVGIRITDLRSVRILNSRVTYSATFEQAADAERFLQAVSLLDQHGRRKPNEQRARPNLH